MGRELAAQRERLRAAEQIAAWQDVARALAHELRNPLTAMKLALARLLRSDEPPDATRLVVHGGTLHLAPAPGGDTLALVELPLGPPPTGPGLTADPRSSI